MGHPLSPWRGSRCSESVLRRASGQREESGSLSGPQERGGRSTETLDLLNKAAKFVKKKSGVCELKKRSSWRKRVEFVNKTAKFVKKKSGVCERKKRSSRRKRAEFVNEKSEWSLMTKRVENLNNIVELVNKKSEAHKLRLVELVKNKGRRLQTKRKSPANSLWTKTNDIVNNKSQQTKIISVNKQKGICVYKYENSRNKMESYKHIWLRDIVQNISATLRIKIKQSRLSIFKYAILVILFAWFI